MTTAIVTATDHIHATARATVKATPKDQRGGIAHIDAAASLAHAAEFLYDAAERVAKGHPAADEELAQLLDFAKRKIQQGEDMLTG